MKPRGDGGKGDAACSRVTQKDKRRQAASTMFQPFNRRAPVSHVAGNLPHWRQDERTYFVTFRTADSLPRQLVQHWEEERQLWLRHNPPPHSEKQADVYWRRFSARFHDMLDAAHGECLLRRREFREIVENALTFFAGERYLLDEFVVMPNHVHALVIPLFRHSLSSVLKSWKSFTARRINILRGKQGAFWQKGIVRPHCEIGRSPGLFSSLHWGQHKAVEKVDAACGRVSC